MGRYTYTLHNTEKKLGEESRQYERNLLEGMTTYQLREICRKEKLVKNMLRPLDREALIFLIMRYRGAYDRKRITSYEKGGIEKLNEWLGEINRILLTDKTFAVPQKLTLYDGLSTGVIDNYQVRCEEELFEGNLLLVDEFCNVAGIFYLDKKEDGIYYLERSGEIPCYLMEGREYFLYYFPKQDSDMVYDVYHGNRTIYHSCLHFYRIPLTKIELRPVHEGEMPLIIDFGNSYTTMGICDIDGNEKLVEVYKPVNGKRELTPLIPSVIAVTGVKDDGPQYAFGYEGEKYHGQLHIDEDVPIFYDIKRWLKDVNQKEEIVLKDGKCLSISRKEMLGAYFQYLIKLATDNFKYDFRQIRLLVPVRQRGRFTALIQELLGEEYYVQCDLDEGVAILFHNIQAMMERDNYRRGQEYQALIVDCGGGTTELTSCRFNIDRNPVSYSIHIETCYENGDAGFGGNNLTFRIFQLLKVKLAESLMKDEGYQRFSGVKYEGYRRMDKALEDGIYNELHQVYELAEAVLPTRYAEYEGRGKEEYFRVKNNHYYLFKLAREIKEAFFQEYFLYELLVLTEAMAGEEQKKNETKRILTFDKWKLSIRQEDNIVPLQKELKALFRLYEIEGLLRTDIYLVMKKFLERMYASGELMDYEIIKLTGQSCKSPLFIEILKEFIPGRIIQDSFQASASSQLKTCCISGGISYARIIQQGYMRVSQNYKVGGLPYLVAAFNHEGEEIVLIRGMERNEETGYISRFMAGGQLDLYLNNTSGELLNTFHYQYDVADFSPTTHEEMESLYQDAVMQEETDGIVDGEIKFFVWIGRERWGFFVLPVLRKRANLLRGEEVFFEFEDDTWEENFFDGSK